MIDKSIIKKWGLGLVGASIIGAGITQYDNIKNLLTPRITIEDNDDKLIKVEEIEDIIMPFNENEKVSLNRVFNKYLSTGNNKLDKSVLNRYKEDISKYLGDDIYIKDISSNGATLYNLDGMEILFSFHSDNSYMNSYIPLNEGKKITYELFTSSYNYSYFEYDNIDSFNKYGFNIYDNNETYYISYKRDDKTSLSFFLKKDSFDIMTNYNRINFKINKEEYQELYSCIISYDKSDNLESFLLNNKVLDKYLAEVRSKNNKVYEELISDMHEILFKEKKLTLK